MNYGTKILDPFSMAMPASRLPRPAASLRSASTQCTDLGVGSPQQKTDSPPAEDCPANSKIRESWRRLPETPGGATPRRRKRAQPRLAGLLNPIGLR